MSKPNVSSSLLGPPLGELSVEAFLRDYWQKKPLFIPGAWPDVDPVLEPEELAGLACEDGVESRLVLENGDSPWQLKQGPFKEEDFTSLPASHYSLLIQDIDKLIPELAPVLERFSFLPSWRIDDLMVSYAADGGSVGPHTDEYDVFLIQVSGKRRWQIAESFDPAIRTDSELKVLETFHAEQEFLCEPGDILYLPPNVAHHGVAVGPCMTWSVGFRAPDQYELASEFTDQLLDSVNDPLRYRDPELSQPSSTSELPQAAIAELQKLIHDAISNLNAKPGQWLGEYLTRPKPWLAPNLPEESLTAEQLKSGIAAGQTLERSIGTRMLWHSSDDASALFVDGIAYPADEALARQLADRTSYDQKLLEQIIRESRGALLLLALYNAGALHWASDSSLG